MLYGICEDQQRTIKSDLIYKFLSSLSRFENIPVKESHVSRATEFNALCIAFNAFKNVIKMGLLPLWQRFNL